MPVQSFCSCNENARTFFDEHGWVVLDSQYSPTESQKLFDASSQFIELQAKEQNKSFQEFIKYISQWRDIWKESPAFDSVLRDERTWKSSAFLMRKKGARLLHDHIILKPKDASDVVPWHQDFSFQPVVPGGLSCWIPLEDVGINQGCLEVVDGSHTWGESSPEDFMNPTKNFDDNKNLIQLAPIRKGSIVILHGLTWHRSLPNMHEGERRVYISLWIPPEARYAKKHASWHPVNERVTVEEGQLLNEDWFPVMGEKDFSDCDDVVPLKFFGPDCESKDITMFTASKVINKQLQSILARGGQQTVGTTSELLSDQTNIQLIVQQCKDIGIGDSDAVQKCLSDLRSSSIAWENHRARNVYNMGYSNWWNIAGKMWHRILAK